MGILDFGCGHSRSYNLQSIVVVFSRSCGDTGPRICTYIVSWNTSTAQVKVTESTLGSDLAVVCSSFEPYRCLARIMWHSDSCDIAEAEFPLRIVIAVCSSFREPCHCVPVVLRHSFTIGISQSHFVLSSGIARFGLVDCAIQICALNCSLDG